MNRNWLLWLLGAGLLLAMLLTLTLGGNRSRHGYGHSPPVIQGAPVRIG